MVGSSLKGPQNTAPLLSKSPIWGVIHPPPWHPAPAQAPGSWDYAYPAMQQQTWAPMQQHIRPPSPMSAAQFAQSLSQSPTEEHAGAGQCTEYYDIGTQDAPGTGLAAALATLPSVGPAVGLATEITAATA